MSDPIASHPLDGSKSEAEPQTEREPGSEVFETSHFYDDGNITFDIRGTMFKVHKSILALYSEVFKDMFGLTHIQPTEGQDEPIRLDDDPKVFHAALDAIYNGTEFIRKADITQLIDAITITRKYQMSRLEGCLQDYIMNSMLPCSIADGVSGARFHLYDKHPGLAVTVLRFGSDELAPWAFYRVGVELFSKISIDDTSTYGPPPTWFAFDPEFAYSFLVLRQIINDAFESWKKGISDFYAVSCPRTSNTRSTTVKCARQAAKFGQESPLYIPSDHKRTDPVREIAPRLKDLDRLLTNQKDAFHSGWCSKCTTTTKDVASMVIKDMHLHLVGCVARMDRMKLRDIPKI